MGIETLTKSREIKSRGCIIDARNAVSNAQLHVHPALRNRGVSTVARHTRAKSFMDPLFDDATCNVRPTSALPRQRDILSRANSDPKATNNQERPEEYKCRKEHCSL